MEYLGEVEATFFKAISSGVVALGARGKRQAEVLNRIQRVVGTDCRGRPNPNSHKIAAEPV